MELYNYFRSSASYRVRIGLALKGLAYDYKPVHLQKNEQMAESYAAVSAARLVPLLKDGDTVLTQSLAILEYLDETHPEPALLPKEASQRAYVRAASQAVACEIHPLNNLRVLSYLTGTLNVGDAAKTAWYRHWVGDGLAKLEAMLVQEKKHGRYTLGDAPGMADATLVPQIFNAQRFGCRVDHVPRVMRVYETCMAMPAFDATQPSKCPDAEA